MHAHSFLLLLLPLPPVPTVPVARPAFLAPPPRALFGAAPCLCPGHSNAARSAEPRVTGPRPRPLHLFTPILPTRSITGEAPKRCPVGAAAQGACPAGRGQRGSCCPERCGGSHRPAGDKPVGRVKRSSLVAGGGAARPVEQPLERGVMPPKVDDRRPDTTVGACPSHGAKLFFNRPFSPPALLACSPIPTAALPKPVYRFSVRSLTAMHERERNAISFELNLWTCSCCPFATPVFLHTGKPALARGIFVSAFHCLYFLPVPNLYQKLRGALPL